MTPMVLMASRYLGKTFSLANLMVNLENSRSSLAAASISWRSASVMGLLTPPGREKVGWMARPAQFHRGRGRRHPKDRVRGLAGGQMVGPRADAADVADDSRHFFRGAAFTK